MIRELADWFPEKSRHATVTVNDGTVTFNVWDSGQIDEVIG